jgi:hypothetical protein
MGEFVFVNEFQCCLVGDQQRICDVVWQTLKCITTFLPSVMVKGYQDWFPGWYDCSLVQNSSANSSLNHQQFHVLLKVNVSLLILEVDVSLKV